MADGLEPSRLATLHLSKRKLLLPRPLSFLLVHDSLYPVVLLANLQRRPCCPSSSGGGVDCLRFVVEGVVVFDTDVSLTLLHRLRSLNNLLTNIKLPSKSGLRPFSLYFRILLLTVGVQ